MQRGDKLYKCWNGTLETMTFLEEGLADPSCTVETYLLRRPDGRKVRCSKAMYLATPQAAYERYLDECREAVPTMRAYIAEQEQRLRECEAEIVRVQALLEPATA